VGGATGAMDVGATHGVGGVVGATWGAVEVVSVARSAGEVGEASNKEAAHGLAVRPPRVAVGPTTSVLWAV
jgi:hypothetical protein